MSLSACGRYSITLRIEPFFKLLQACHNKRLQAALNHLVHATHVQISMQISMQIAERLNLDHLLSQRTTNLLRSSRPVQRFPREGRPQSIDRTSAAMRDESSSRLPCEWSVLAPSPAEIRCLRVRPLEAFLKHLTSRIAASLLRSPLPRRPSAIARPDLAMQVFPSLFPLFSLCGFSVCLSLTFVSRFSSLFLLTCSFPPRKSLLMFVEPSRHFTP